MKTEFKAGAFALGKALMSLCDRLADAFANGATSRFLTSYRDTGKLLDDTLMTRVVTGETTRKRGFIRRVRTLIARQFEESLLLYLISRFRDYLLGCQVRFFGAFFAAYGGYTALLYIIRKYALADGGVDGYANLVAGLIIFVTSIPLFFSGKTLAVALGTSTAARAVLIGVFGIPEEKLTSGDETGGTQTAAVISGIVCGMLTYILPPLYVIWSIAAVAALGLLLSYPEAGVVIIIASVPFLGVFGSPSVTLGGLMLLTVLGYMMKLLRGKRVFRFGYSDLPVLLFWFALLLGGAVPGDVSAVESSLLSCALLPVYFLAVNLIRDKRWLRSCVASLIASATVTSFIGVAEYLLGYADTGWLDTSLYSGIVGRTTSTFTNPNVLAVYIILAFPLSLALMFIKNNPRIKIIAGISSVTMLLCVVFTWSRGAWLALALSSSVFLITVSPRFLALIPPVAGGVLLAGFVFPSSFGARLANFVSVADSANHYRLLIWRGVWKMLGSCWLTGIGTGEYVFRSVYVNFAYAGIEAAPHAHSLYLQLVAEVGVIGLIFFIWAMIAMMRRCVSYMVHGQNREATLICSACMCGAIALLVAGLFDYTWYNYRVFFVFWAVVGLACAAVDVGGREDERRNRMMHGTADNDAEHADITVTLTGTGGKERV